MGSSSMPGYGFHPTEEELVSHYLKKKMLGHDDQVSIIADVDLNKCEPWDLPNYSVIKKDDPEWYFFSSRKTKYRNSKRADRTTEAGYWKSTGKDRVIRDSDTREEIAIKKSLVFHMGRFPNGVKTDWVMHEYNPTFHLPDIKRGDIALYKLKNNSDDYTPSYQEGEMRSSAVASNFENQIPNNNNFPNFYDMQGQLDPMMHNYSYDSNFPQVDPHLQSSVESFQDHPKTSYSLNDALGIGSPIYSPGGSYSDCNYQDNHNGNFFGYGGYNPYQ